MYWLRSGRRLAWTRPSSAMQSVAYSFVWVDAAAGAATWRNRLTFSQQTRNPRFTQTTVPSTARQSVDRLHLDSEKVEAESSGAHWVDSTVNLRVGSQERVV